LKKYLILKLIYSKFGENHFLIKNKDNGTLFKFNSNILKIKLFYLKFSGKIHENNFKLDTSIPIDNIQSVLMIFPVEEEDFNVAKYCFKSLFSGSHIRYTYLISNVFYSSIRFKGDMYGFNYIKKKNKVILNDNFKSENTINKEFDVIIDLNSNFMLDIAMIINKLKSNYKIGFKNKYSDFFYNIQFKYSTLEEYYSKIKLMLS